jgi:hypothetical protein
LGYALALPYRAVCIDLELDTQESSSEKAVRQIVKDVNNEPFPKLREIVKIG